LTVREIRLYGDPVLRSECEAVKDVDSVRALVQDLLETTALPGRAGVAANQIGVGLRVFAYNIKGEIGYLINPQITSLSGEQVLMEEGCLSVPGLWHPTPRYENATAQGLQLDGSIKTISGTGLMAQAIQHECDHLDGRVYLQRLEPQERKIAMALLRQQAWFKNL
jgi:peptide deformylase